MIRKILDRIKRYRLRKSIKCMYSTEEIARSFIEDVKAVEEYLPKGD